jgi:hypothetical protein
MSQNLYAVLLVLLLISCGKSEQSSTKKTVPILPEEIEDILDRQKFTCQSISGGPCPQGIARLFIIDQANPQLSSLCTGYMINANTLVTNNHCVPDAISCQNTYVSIRTAGEPIKARCNDIVFTEGDGEISQARANDITVFHINVSYGGPVFNVSQVRPSIGQKVTIWVVDHFTILDAAITELECEYISKPGAMEFNNCPAISGNSGSPIVLSGSTTAIGVLWGSTVPPIVDASFPLQERRAFKAISLGTELFPFLSELQ